MKSSTHDKVEGVAKILAGKMAEFTGKGLGDRRLQARGAEKQVEGKTQKKIGEIEKVFGN
jgi:uncharacterized protein YjbJ (UPF0337 family)